MFLDSAAQFGSYEGAGVIFVPVFLAIGTKGKQALGRVRKRRVSNIMEERSKPDQLAAPSESGLVICQFRFKGGCPAFS